MRLAVAMPAIWLTKTTVERTAIPSVHAKGFNAICVPAIRHSSSGSRNTATSTRTESGGTRGSVSARSGANDRRKNRIVGTQSTLRTNSMARLASCNSLDASCRSRAVGGGTAASPACESRPHSGQQRTPFGSTA
jgi:hypothetical protein